MSLSKFPFPILPVLAMERIVAGWNAEQIFSFSMCSKKCTAVIARATRFIPPIRMRIEIGTSYKINLYKMTNPHDDERIELIREGAEEDESISLNEYDVDEDMSAEEGYEARADELECWLYWLMRWDFDEPGWRVGDCERSKWNISGVNVETRKRPNNNDCQAFTAICPSGTMDTTINAIITQIFRIFPKCTVEALYTNFRRLDEGFEVKKAIAAITTAEKVSVDETNNYNEDVVYIHKNIEVTKEYINYSHSFHTYEPMTTKIKCSDSINCYNPSFMGPGFLLDLTCPDVNLRNARFRSEDLMAFIRKWKSSPGDEMKKIESIQISNVEDFEKLNLEEFEAKAWDPEVRNKEFYISKKYHRDLSTGLDIQRSDGLLATVSHWGTHFEFVVWHNTDPETGKRVSERDD